MVFPSGAMNNTTVTLGVMFLLLALGYRLSGNVAMDTVRRQREPGRSLVSRVSDCTGVGFSPTSPRAAAKDAGPICKDAW